MSASVEVVLDTTPPEVEWRWGLEDENGNLRLAFRTDEAYDFLGADLDGTPLVELEPGVLGGVPWSSGTVSMQLRDEVLNVGGYGFYIGTPSPEFEPPLGGLTNEAPTGGRVAEFLRSGLEFAVPPKGGLANESGVGGTVAEMRTSGDPLEVEKDGEVFEDGTTTGGDVTPPTPKGGIVDEPKTGGYEEDD
jgi:hypothetical protein